MSYNQGMTVTPSGIPLSETGVITASHIDNGPPKKADLVEVIRCKDCKWREHEWTPDRGDEYWCEFGRAADEEGNGFCSIAERKEE